MHLGTTIIVGAGPGLGRALARCFARAGHPVALIARDADRLDSAAVDLRAAGHRVSTHLADAADPGALRRAVHDAVAASGAPDVLIYNAAALRSDSPTDGDDDGWRHAMAVDVLGAKVAAETVLPVLRDHRGSLLFTGGGLALDPSPAYASVSVGKAALRAYVHALHRELAGSGVRATSITIDGSIGGDDPRFAPDTLAEAYLRLHQQPPADWRHEFRP